MSLEGEFQRSARAPRQKGRLPLCSAHGNDQLFGETGDDNLQGGNGDDSLAGGLGSDTCTDAVGINTFAQCDLGAPNNSCADTVKDGTETAVDCGGGCPACATGVACVTGGDCLSNVCSGGVCQDLRFGIQVIPVVDTDWGGGYCVHLNVTNVASVPTVNWTATVNTNQSTIYTSWKANFSASSGVVTVTPNVPSSQVINPNATDSSVGFCANRNVSGSSVLPFAQSATGMY